MSYLYEDVVLYLEKGLYGEGLDKVDKRRLRQKCESFQLVNGELFHLGKKNKLCRVILDDDRKTNIMTTMHSGLKCLSSFVLQFQLSYTSFRYLKICWRRVTPEINDVPQQLKFCA